MSSLSNLYLKKETLETLLKGVNAKELNGIDITISINDEVKTFEGKNGTVVQNVSAFVSQSKEERDSKKDKFYVGNGRVFWTDGSISVAEQPQSNSSSPKKQKEEVVNDLPWYKSFSLKTQLQGLSYR
jgi:hypothetical protein